MPLYEYKGIQNGDKNTKGVIEADSVKAARTKLKTRGIYAISITEKKEADKEKQKKSPFQIGGGVKKKEVAMMTRQLATLVKARIPLDDALQAIVEQSESPKLKGVMSQVKDRVNEGKSLAEALKEFPNAFPPLYTSMIRVGEVSGNLDLVLLRLADFSEYQIQIQSRVQGAIMYPLIVMGISVALTFFLFAFVVPKITEVFAGSKTPIPMITQILITISAFVSQNWIFLVLVALGAFFSFRWFLSTAQGGIWWDTQSLKLPIFGKLLRMVAVSRFSKTLSTLIGSGVQLLDAIDIVKDVVDNHVLKVALEKSRESISEGQTIAAPLKASGQFPPILTHMIAIGEKTGELEDMLNVVSSSYDMQVDNAINTMTSTLTPLMIVFMGVVFGFVAVAVILPMLQMSSLTNLG